MIDVPWLNHLRRDRRGLPVPYINLWGPETTDRLAIRHDENVRGPAVFLDDDDETVPDFTRQNMQRQRECVTQGLCQVCRRFVPWSRRVLVIAALSCEQIVLEGRRTTVVTEPWLCRRCAEFAVTVCPALIRRRRDEDLRIIEVPGPRQFRIVISRGWIDGPLEEQSRQDPPAIWAKILLLSPRIESRT